MTDRNEKETGTTERMMDKAGGMVGKASAATMGSVSAHSFIENASIGDLYEIEAARIADRRARSPEIRRMAEELHADHVTGAHQLRSALRMAETDARPAAEMDSRRRTMIDHLERASDEEFDKVWLEQQRTAHGETETLFEGFAAHGSDSQLRSYARSILPGLKLHRRAVEAASA